MMAPAYKRADGTILALIEALILNYVVKVQSRTFYSLGPDVVQCSEPIVLLVLVFCCCLL